MWRRRAGSVSENILIVCLPEHARHSRTAATAAAASVDRRWPAERCISLGSGPGRVASVSMSWRMILEERMDARIDRSACAAGLNDGPRRPRLLEKTVFGGGRFFPVTGVPTTLTTTAAAAAARRTNERVASLRKRRSGHAPTRVWHERPSRGRRCLRRRS